MEPARMSDCVLALSTLTCVVAPLPTRSLKRRRSRCAPSSCAWSLTSTPSACSIWASICRLSSVNSKSPSLTLAPSSKWTATMVVSSRDFSATLEIGVTIPIASTSTGMDLRSALASSTETIRGRCGPWALLLPPLHQERGKKPRRGSNADRASKKYQGPFFNNFSRPPVLKDWTVLLVPLDGDFCALFLNGYNSLPAHGMPLPENV